MDDASGGAGDRAVGAEGDRTDRAAVEVTRRIARSVQTTVGWIFWDPGAVSRYEALGLPGPLGYIAARGAPFAGVGPEAVAAAFGSISPLGIALAFDQLGSAEAFWPFWHARDEAVAEGLQAYAPGIVDPLVAAGPGLWGVVERLPMVGRPFTASHLAVPRPEDPLLSAWHAVNVVREWRGDTHWAIVAAQGLSGDEASVLHNAWLGYERDWLPRSRGAAPDAVERAWADLADRGLVADGEVTAEGIGLRQWIEDETDRRTTRPWELFGLEATTALAEALEPPCVGLLRRVDETAGPNYQPASRVRPPRA